MLRRQKQIAAILLFSGLCFAAQSQRRLADSMQRKLDHIQHNAASRPVDQTPTVMTEEEVNDYLASGRIDLPQGVKSVTLTGQSGVVVGIAVVDFDRIRASHNSSNPLLSLFSGTHNVRVEADASAAGGAGKVHVRTVSIDDVEVPRVALEYFASKYITPKYPGVGMDSEFELPDRINTATVGYHKVIITQK